MSVIPNIGAGIAGLTLDTFDVLSSAPSVVIYGVAGGGKTFQMASAFQNALYIQTSPSILRAFADWVKKHPELKWKVPQHLTFDEGYVMTHGGSWTMCLIDIMTKYLAACDAGTNPYDGIIFDEWSTICENVFAEAKTDPWGKFKGRNGKLNIFAVFDFFKDVHRNALAIGRRSRKMVGFVSHAQMPKMVDDDGMATKGLNGNLKWRGGPKMPMGLSDQSALLCSDADVVLQLEIRETKKPMLDLGLGLTPAAAPSILEPVGTQAPAVTMLDMLKPGASIAEAALQATNAAVMTPATKTDSAPIEGERFFYTQLDDRWFRKIRGFGVQAEEPIDIHKGQGLREILRRAGYAV